MKRLHEMTSALIVVLCAAALLTGCQGSTRAGTKYRQLPTGALQAHLAGDINTVHNKALAVLRDDFGFTINKEAKDAMEGIIQATTARNDKVTVETFRDAEQVTKVQVRVGTFEKLKAEEILNKIESGLGTARTE